MSEAVTASDPPATAEPDAPATDATALPASLDGNGPESGTADSGPTSVADDDAGADVADNDAAAVEVPQITPPDPHHLTVERPCPLCDGAGMLPYGILLSPRYTTCDECGGIGQVFTGSLVSASAVADCEKCNGGGFVSIQAAPAAGETPVTVSGTSDAPPWPGAVRDPATGLWQ